MSQNGTDFQQTLDLDMTRRLKRGVGGGEKETTAKGQGE